MTPVAFASLPGWAEDRQGEALAAVRRSCGRLGARPPSEPVGFAGTAGDWRDPCRQLQALAPGDHAGARAAFERLFQPYMVAGDGRAEGLFTGYYEPEMRGTRTRKGRFTVPLYRAPDDLVRADLGDFDSTLAGRSVVGRLEGGRFRPYPTRGTIDGGALAGRGLELVWLDDTLDAFVLHVQGSGRVLLDDGSAMRVGFAAHNGHTYASIGTELIRRGELSRDRAAWPDIRAWLDRNPAKAAELLAVNRRYIFFREITGEGPIGAEGVPLTAQRSLAVDPAYVPFGVPLWLEAADPLNAARPIRRLMVAQDAGAAIKGVVRGDFFWGTGDEAGRRAGMMRSPGRYFALVPRTVRVTQRPDGGS